MAPLRPRDLPDELADIFTTADALRHGISPDRLRARDLDRTVRGVRAPTGTAEDLRQRCRMFAARVNPEAFVSHSTAARLIGAPIPMRFERMASIHFTVAAPARAPHARGLIGHSRVVIHGDVITDPDGLRRSSPDRIVCEMGRVLDLGDLVALIDFVASSRSPLTSLPALSERIEIGDRLTRAHHLRRALELADPRAESRPESRLRVMLVSAGLGGWEPNYPIVDPESGRQFRIDLAHPGSRVAIEYQGDYHRSVEQWRRDITRRSLLESFGWRVIEINADDLRAPAELVDRIRRIMALAAG